MTRSAAHRSTIERHSKSFALAARLLPGRVADDAVLLYAWCRRADDLIDLASPEPPAERVARLEREIETLQGKAPLDDPLLEELRLCLDRCGIPGAYLGDFIAGLRMDTTAFRYRLWSELLDYAYRVAGTVGLMMCHVMGVRRPSALVHAAHLGIAMQLTNVARDVLEDWERGRLYLPDQLLRECGAPDLRSELGAPFPASAAAPVARATARVLARADRYYRSGDLGLRELSPRCALAVRTARQVYSRIGDAVRAQDCNPLAGRAFVSRGGKARALARAVVGTALDSSLPWSVMTRIPSIPSATARRLRSP